MNWTLFIGMLGILSTSGIGIATAYNSWQHNRNDEMNSKDQTASDLMKNALSLSEALGNEVKRLRDEETVHRTTIAALEKQVRQLTSENERLRANRRLRP